MIYMKGEKVSTKELARLLYFREAEDAEDFAIHMVGLTKLDTDVVENEDIKIVFKIGPISRSNQLGTGRRRQDDEFVFGRLYNDSYWSSTRADRKSLATAWDDAPTLSSEQSGRGTQDSASKIADYSGARVDAEGVHIPPPDLLYRILVSS